MSRLKGIYILDSSSLPRIYGPDEQRDIAALVDLVAAPQTNQSVASNPQVLADVDVVFSGWGGPRVDEVFLAAAPRIKAIFYGAGAVGGIVTPAMWQRGIRITSAYAANAIPVAEYTLATILFSLKRGWWFARQTRQLKAYPPQKDIVGAYGATVGLVSMGMIARTLLKLLKPFSLRVVVYDPFMTPAQAAELGVELLSLEELFRQSDVVSVHTPWLAETVGMITGALLDSMKPQATFINTSRGAVVRENEMTDVLARRSDLQAIIDVTYPAEPPKPDSPLYTLPNVVLTPHIAGSLGKECQRMGRYMVEELQRYLAGKPLQWEITPELANSSSHRPPVKA